MPALRTFAFTAIIAITAAACGGKAPEPASTAPALPETLAGIHASDIAKVMRVRGLVCGEPAQEREFKHWMCEARTPLLGYLVEYYGKAPGRIEYIRMVATQSGAPKLEGVLPVVFEIANLRYSDVDRAAAKTWVEKNLQTGGATTIGAAKLKVSGDLSRLVFEIKATGSEW
jgi:hypothetical protein